MALPLLGRYRGVVPFHPSFNSATFPLRENKIIIPFQSLHKIGVVRNGMELDCFSCLLPP